MEKAETQLVAVQEYSKQVYLIEGTPEHTYAFIERKSLLEGYVVTIHSVITSKYSQYTQSEIEAGAYDPKEGPILNALNLI